MEDTFWSKKVQGIRCLDDSRRFRFRDDRKDLILRVLGLSPGMKVVDVGCGPGSVTRKIGEWLGPSSEVIGVDRDVNFVEYANEQAKTRGPHNVHFVPGDALALPLEDGSVDACISHSVIEHVENIPFLLEQKRITKKGGRVSVMSVRPENSLTSAPDEILPISRAEQALWEEIGGKVKQEDGDVGAHWVEPHELPCLFAKAGFSRIEVDALALPVVPDDARNSREERLAMLRAREAEAMERIEMLYELIADCSLDGKFARLKELVAARFNRRLQMAEADTPAWDYHISMVLVVSGTV